MKLAAMAVAVLAIGALAWWGFSKEPPKRAVKTETPREEKPRERKPRRTLLPQGVCRIEGDLSNGTGRSVRVFSRTANADIDAVLEGARFSADLPAYGEVSITAVATDGRTVTLDTQCSGARVALAFPGRVQGGVKLEGRCVYLETGAGVPGARVGSGEASTLTDDEGRFVLFAFPGEHQLSCARDNDRSEEVSARPGRPVELQLPASTSVTGRVIDEAGRAVEGAYISGIDPRTGVRADTSSDERGAFVLDRLPPGPVTIDAQLDGKFAEAQVLARLGLPYAEVELTLKSGGPALRGRVIDEDEVPIEGASILLASHLTRTQKSDADGRFVIAGIAEGGVVSVDAPGFAAQVRTISELKDEQVFKLERACFASVRVMPAEPRLPVRVNAEGEAFGETGAIIRVEATPGVQEISAMTVGPRVVATSTIAELCASEAVLELRLDAADRGELLVEVERANGSPVEGADITIVPSEKTARSDARGAVIFASLEPGVYRVFSRDQREEIEVSAGTPARVKLVIKDDEVEGEVSGYVTSLGRPVEGAAIRAKCGETGFSRNFDQAEVVARSNSAGAFAFDPERGATCLVRAEHFDEGSSDAVVLRANGTPGELELHALTSIEGRAVDQNGAPVTRYQLYAEPVGRAGSIEKRALFINDAQGEFRVSGLTPGLISLTVRADSGEGHVEVMLPAGESVEGVEIPLLSEGTVRGRVISNDGLVVGARVRVRALGEEQIQQSGNTGPDGSFEVKMRGGFPMVVTVSRPGFYPWGSPPFDFDARGVKDLGMITLSPRSGSEEKEGGIGIRFAPDPHGVSVVDFVPNSPGREAGLELGDVITAIDGVSASRLPLISWLVALRGPVGTVVVLEIERGTSPRFSVSVIRRAVGLPELPE